MFGKIFKKRSLSQEKVDEIFTDCNADIINNGSENYIYNDSINELCNQIAKIPLNLYKIDNKCKNILDCRLNEILSIRANPYQTSFSLLYNLMYQVIKNGIGAIYIKRDNKGQIIALYNVDNIQINYDINVFTDVKNVNYTGTVYNYSKKFLEDELCIIRDKEDLMQNRAGSNITSLLDANNKQIKLLNKIFSGENLSDNLVLQQETDSEVFKDNMKVAKLINSWMNLMKNNGIEDSKTKVVPPGWKLTSISPKLTDNQFLEIKQDTGDEIRKHLGLYINGSDEEELNFLQNRIEPLVTKIQQELNYKLLTKEQRKTLKIEFNITNFIKISQEKHIDILKTLISSGIITTNEARMEINYNPKESGDSILVNSGVYRLDMLDNIIKSKINQKKDKLNEIDDEPYETYDK